MQEPRGVDILIGVNGFTTTSECKTTRGRLALSDGSVGCAQEGLYAPFWSHPIQGLDMVTHAV
jgi:hypothetical protein